MAIKFLNTVAVDENVLFVDTVNDRVGIGTDIPEGNLEISDSTQATGATLSITNAHIGSWVTGDKIGSIDFRIDDTSTTQPVRAKIHAEGKTTGTYPSSSQLVFSTANVNTLYERMRIDSAGNVGIGTTSPSTKLDIINSGLSTMFRLSNTEANATTKYGAILGRHYTNTEENVTGMLITSSSNALSGQTVSIGGGISAANAVNNVIFYTAANNTTLTGSERMRITSGGNVGIGTTSPSNTLQVGDGTEDSAIAVYFSDGSYTRINGYGLYMSRTASYIRPTTTTTKTLYIGAPSNIWNAISNNANTHYFITGTNEHMRINSAGKVGIGTTSPSEKLDVVGNVKIKDALLSNQENTDIDSAAAEMVAQVAIADYTAAFFDFVIKKTTNVRSGTVYACHDGTNVEFTETSTNDLGDTSDVTLSVDISGGNMRLRATTTSDDWSVKSLIRAI